MNIKKAITSKTNKILFTILLISTNIGAINSNSSIAPNDIIRNDSLGIDSLRFQNIPDTAQYNDSLALVYPAYKLYNCSWTPFRLNPYRIAIDSMPDSININCMGYVYPTKSNRITSRFGYRCGRYHNGIDIGLQYGDSIYATFSGKVRIVDYERRGYGHYVVIRHDNGLETVMAHLSRVKVKIDQTVEAGDLIGLGGSTGRSTGPHLHYEIRFLGNAFNPTKIIDIETKNIILENDTNFLLTHASTYSHNKELKQLAQAAYHRVRPGETLSHIAHRYGTSVRRLCSLNRIRETSILQIGQRIRYR